ncbi:hypothetical protein EBZ37_12145, partial [bacterium]|nr:hypothetical protein [bacterium]
MWDHPSFYIPQREWLQTRVWEELHPRVHLVFDSRHSFGASHHEKMVMVDGRIALTGGVDLCADRWDSTQHLAQDPRRSLDRHQEDYGPYHELGVQVSGPVCLLIHQHIRRRWRLLSSIPFPEAIEDPSNLAAESGHHVWMSRTRSCVDPGEAHRPIIREVEFLFLELISRAEKEIWLEGQYFWSRHVARALQARILQATSPLRITLIIADLSHLKLLPARMAEYQAHLLAELQRSALTKKDLIDLRIYRPSSGSRPIYVHSKLVLTDDRFISIGSANFSARALRMDSEFMLTFEATSESERLHVQHFREALDRHWGATTLAPVDSIAEEEIISRRNPILSKIAWYKSLDPEIPYFHRIKRRIFGRLEKRATRVLAQAAALLIFWSLGFLPISIILAKKSPDLGIMGWTITALLFSVWIVPVPFLALVIAASLQLELRLASQVVVLSWWMAGILSTLWGRTFPTILR